MHSSTHSSSRHWMEVSGQLHAPAANPQGKSLWYTLDRRLGSPRANLDAEAKRKKSHHCPPRELSSGSPARSLFPILSDVYFVQTLRVEYTQRGTLS
jgi:hypothetical protein